MDAEKAAETLDKLKEAGFNKGMIVNFSYKTLATYGGAEASGYTDSAGVTVNENQEMTNNWFADDRSTFKFFKLKFNLILKSADDHQILGKKGTDFLVGFIGPDFWLLTHATQIKKDDDGKVVSGVFADARKALGKAISVCFDELKEDVYE